MIFRRVLQHVRDQNWTAIGIDLVIVVVGVFLGIQLGNWNAARADERRATAYLVRLHDDLSDDLVMLDARKAFWEQTTAAGLDALAADLPAAPTRDEAWRVVRAFHHASNTLPLSLRDGTYTDMVSSGQLGLVSDTDLRDRTTTYYTNSWGVELSSDIPAYRRAVRRVIPPDVHAHLMTCHRVEGAHRHVLDACPPPAGGADLVALAGRLTRDDALRGDLYQALSIMRTSSKISDDVLIPAARALRDRVAAELDGRGAGGPSPS
ncbi:DUF6090 family protein [Rubrivirga sp. IMCC45206]|uniref:DUF6090 family protein n=1 Tax=Rubrivirga sp. IMCC45206 TaxID=3391614 RepID=UPI0039900D38